MRKLFRLTPLLVLLAILSACTVSRVPPQPGPQTGAPQRVVKTDAATQQFAAVAGRVEPVARSVCRQANTRGSCNFTILIDERPGQGVNAFQTVNRRGQPILVFTRGIVEEFSNGDEIAFVIGHEAAHHIEGHLTQRAQAAGALGAALEAAAAASGAPSSGRASASQLGQAVGSRVFSKQFELEADALGAVIAARAGFDPVRGAQFFNRLPDPGDQFLGSHPPNAERIRVVREVAAQLN
ncbi:MAG: M48 family metallopeptidase [Pseudomonadota bacterium]